MTESAYSPAALLEIALKGHGLKSSEASSLSQDLDLRDDQIELRVTLLGYYFARYLSKESFRRLRTEHIFWLVSRMAENAFLAHPIAIILKIPNSKNGDYEAYKQLWMTKIEEFPASLPVRLNAALALSYSDMELATGILEEARRLAPEDMDVNKLGQDFIRRRTPCD